MEEFLSVNRAYAEKYDQFRKKEELQKLKDRYGENPDEDSSSPSESEDEDATALTARIEKDFLRTLAYVKRRDPKIYDKEVKFYHTDESEDESSDETETAGSKTTPKKALYLKDYDRKILLEKGGKFDDENESDEDDDDDDDDERPPMSPTYVQEQEALKESFKGSLFDDDKDEEFLTKRKKSKQEQEMEEEEYIQWLKGQEIETSQNSELKEMDSLRRYWNDPKLDDGEKFLRDYILNKGYIDKDSIQVPTYEEIVDEVHLSEEEVIIEKQENFERNFNFRYEEPESATIRRYPRNIGDTVRRKDTKRSEKRVERKSRKEMEKEKKKEEIKQLKNLKKQEILDKIEKLKTITGNPNVGFEDKDIEGDFDPAEYDKKMKTLFNNEYYGMEEDGDEKPEFSDEEFDCVDWDQWQGHDEETVGKQDGDGGGAELYCDDPNFNMDADYDPSQERVQPKQKSSDFTFGKKRKKKKSKFAEALEKNKPTFDPDDKTFEEYFEEYYKLDYEDIIGDMPCRFKYRSTVANDFGLSTQEILSAQDKQLNRWASLKKTVQYRPEEVELRELNIFKKRARNLGKKKYIFPDLYSEEPEKDKEQTGENVNKKKRKLPKSEKSLPNKKAKQDQTSNVTDGKANLQPKKRRKKRANADQAESNQPVAKPQKKKSAVEKKTQPAEINQSQTETETASKKRKRKRGKKKNTVDYQLEVSDKRLKAYGINAKGFRWKEKQKQKASGN